MIKKTHWCYVGSYALQLLGFDVENSDLDMFVCDSWENFYKKDRGKQHDITFIPKHIVKYIGSIIPTIDQLYTIKCSHLGWDNNQWTKHKKHILWFNSIGAKLDVELYNMLVEHWKEKNQNKEFLSLDNSKEKFFTDHVNYRFDHDDLHLIVASPNKPAYQSVLKEGQEVSIDKNKFDKLPHSTKIKIFKEEINTICLERWLLNEYWLKTDLSINKAHSLALKKTITNLTKNWACDFIVQNLKEFVIPDYQVYNRVITELLTKPEKEKYMRNKGLVEYFEGIEKSIGYDEGLENFLFTLAADYFYGETTEILKQTYGYKHLQQEGGGEGGAEDCFGVFELEGKAYRVYYSYYSYHGHDLTGIVDSLKEVAPVQKTVTVYE